MISMKTLVIGNRKGGVAKTSTAHALGDALSAKYRVLLVDMDPQSSLSESCGVEAGERTLVDVLGDAEPGTATLFSILREIKPNLFLAPANKSLSRSELGLVPRLGRELVLKRALATLSGFDLCIIDTPPGLSLLSVNALAAADGLLIPTVPQVPDLRGLRKFISNIEDLRKDINPGLQVLGILVTFYDPRLVHHNSAVKAMQKSGVPVLEVRIGRSVRVSEAANNHQSIVSYDPKNKQAQAYQRLGKVVEQWLKSK